VIKLFEKLFVPTALEGKILLQIPLHNFTEQWLGAKLMNPWKYDEVINKLHWAESLNT